MDGSCEQAKAKLCVFIGEIFRNKTRLHMRAVLQDALKSSAILPDRRERI